MRPLPTFLLLGLILGSTLEVHATARTGPEIPAANAFAPPTAVPDPPGRPDAPDPPDDEAPPADTGPTRKNTLARYLPHVAGYLQLGGEVSETTSTFFLKRACLYLTGSFTPTLNYHFQFDFALPNIIDAYLSYRPLLQLGIKAGEFKVPFSIENTVYSPVKFEFIEYPLALTRLMGLNDICGLRSTGRDLGASLYGGFLRRGDRCLLSYEIGLFNGEGINTRDRNRTKDLSAQLTLEPCAGLRLSASYYWGEYGPQYLRRVRYGAGICYDRYPVVVRSEWIGGETGLPSRDGARAGMLESRGWYAMGGWWVTRTWMPVVRCDTFLEDTSSRQTRQCNCTAGTVWQPIRHLRCQLNYTYEHHAARTTADRNVLSVMVSGIF